MEFNDSEYKKAMFEQLMIAERNKRKIQQFKHEGDYEIELTELEAVIESMDEVDDELLLFADSREHSFMTRVRIVKKILRI